MIGLDTEYYSPVVHHAAFAMPPRFARNYDDDQSEERFARPLPDWIGGHPQTDVSLAHVALRSRCRTSSRQDYSHADVSLG